MAEATRTVVGSLRRAVLVLRCQVRGVHLDTFHLPLGAMLLPQESRGTIRRFLSPAFLRGARVQRVVHSRDHPSMLGTLFH